MGVKALRTRASGDRGRSGIADDLNVLIPLLVFLRPAVQLDDDLIVLDLNVGDHAAVTRPGRGTILRDLLGNLRFAGAHYAILDLDSLVALRKRNAGEHTLRLQAAHHQQPGLAGHLFRLIGIGSLGGLRE